MEQPGPLPTGGLLDLLLFRRLIVRDLAERLLESFFVFVTTELASGFNKAIKLRFADGDCGIGGRSQAV